MTKVSLIILVVIVALIIRQFIPKQISRFDLLGLPIMALIRTYAGLPDSLNMFVMTELLCLLALGVAVGYMQAKKTKIIDRNNIIYTVGGYSYLIGLLVMLIGRLLIMFLFNLSPLIEAFHTGGEQFTNKIIQLLSNSGDWLIWSTIAASSILYSLTLYREHPKIKEFIHEQVKQIGR